MANQVTLSNKNESLINVLRKMDMNMEKNKFIAIVLLHPEYIQISWC